MFIYSSDIIFAECEYKNYKYPIHKNISATVFWIGEKGNEKSAWNENWIECFGGIDDPKNRKNYKPSKFTPKQNPFYCALPYNDFENSIRKKNIMKFTGQERKIGLKKNQCVKIDG